MVRQGVTLAHYALDKFWVLLGAGPDHEESSLEMVVAQDVEYGGGGDGVWPVSECQGDSMAELHGFARRRKGRRRVLRDGGGPRLLHARDRFCRRGRFWL